MSITPQSSASRVSSALQTPLSSPRGNDNYEPMDVSENTTTQAVSNPVFPGVNNFQQLFTQFRQEMMRLQDAMAAEFKSALEESSARHEVEKVALTKDVCDLKTKLVTSQASMSSHFNSVMTKQQNSFTTQIQNQKFEFEKVLNERLSVQFSKLKSDHENILDEKVDATSQNFKNEIDTLKSQINDLSLERDNLRNFIDKKFCETDEKSVLSNVNYPKVEEKFDTLKDEEPQCNTQPEVSGDLKNCKPDSFSHPQLENPNIFKFSSSENKEKCSFPLTPSTVKVPDLPTFRGESSDALPLESWLFRVRKIQELCNWNDKTTLSYCVTFLAGQAMHFFQISNKDILSVGDLEKLLSLRFGKSSGKSDILNQISILKMRSRENIYDFNIRVRILFKEYLQKFPGVPESLLITYYLHALHDEICTQVVLEEPKTINDTYLLSEKVYRAITYKRSSQNSQNSVNLVKSPEKECLTIEDDVKVLQTDVRELKNLSKQVSEISRSINFLKRELSQKQKVHSKSFRHEKSGNFENVKNSKLCDFCKRPNHTENDCWKKYPEKLPPKYKMLENKRSQGSH